MSISILEFDIQSKNLTKKWELKDLAAIGSPAIDGFIVVSRCCL